MIDILLIFVIGLLAGFVGAIATGAGLITIPLFFLMGIPPQLAIATHKVGMLAQSFGSLSRFIQTKHIQWEMVVPLTVLGTFGAYIGSMLLISFVDDVILKKIISVAILSLVPFYFLKKNLGVKKKTVSPALRIIGYVFFGLFSIWSGFFGAGSGFFFIFFGLHLFGISLLELKATYKIPAIFLMLTSVLIFYFEGLLRLDYSIAIFISMLIGSYLGAGMAIKKGDAFVKTLVGIIVVISSVLVLFF